jgi:hypothetical protein
MTRIVPSFLLIVAACGALLSTGCAGLVSYTHIERDVSGFARYHHSESFPGGYCEVYTSGPVENPTFSRQCFRN